MTEKTTTDHANYASEWARVSLSRKGVFAVLAGMGSILVGLAGGFVYFVHHIYEDMDTKVSAGIKAQGSFETFLQQSVPLMQKSIDQAADATNRLDKATVKLDVAVQSIDKNIAELKTSFSSNISDLKASFSQNIADMKKSFDTIVASENALNTKIDKLDAAIEVIKVSMPLRKSDLVGESRDWPSATEPSPLTSGFYGYNGPTTKRTTSWVYAPPWKPFHSEVAPAAASAQFGDWDQYKGSATSLPAKPMPAH